ncbi:hypothetical protein F5B20DRAFT_593131 [Whalleya microplaca]|nr:hypothetical protein F5B20DRAFT_593131 [Whalleya microplaca]
MTSTAKTAIITGGANGIGLAVAQALATRGEWEIHLIDLNAAAGNAAASSLGATFHEVDVTAYQSLGSVFKAVFQKSRRLDFVFANAGIAQIGNFYERHDEIGDEVPPPPNMLVVKICLEAVVTTAHLALYYFRLTPEGVDKSLIMTASCGGIYPSYYASTYTAAKHGVVGLTRAISRQLYVSEGIRVNAICPGIIKTGLMGTEEWSIYPDEMFTTVEKVAQRVLMLIDGEDNVTAEKTRIDREVPEKKGVLWGEVVEISGNNHYYREMPKYCDELMERVIEGTYIAELPGTENSREFRKISGQMKDLVDAVD